MKPKFSKATNFEKIDCVFKALLGAEENRNLLMHFLNALLGKELAEPLVWVEILNPYNDKEFLSDKLSVVDVKARDSRERLYQIEIQLTAYRHLPARIIYNWADIYSQQLKSGDDYAQLRPTYAIWLLAENLLPEDEVYVHHYKMRDEQGRTFQPHGGIWLLELNKFKAQRIETEEQRWLKFFKDGEDLNDEALPDWMSTEEMKQAMSTLSKFSEKERQYFQYQARQEYLREQRTKQLEYEQAKQDEDEARKRAELAMQREEQARQREVEARQREEEAKRREEVARQGEEEAKKQTEIAIQEAEIARRDAETAKSEIEAAHQREFAAVTEIERLKAMLAQKLK